MKLSVLIFFCDKQNLHSKSTKVLQASILDSATAYSYSGFPEKDTSRKRKYSFPNSLSNEGLLSSVSSSLLFPPPLPHFALMESAGAGRGGGRGGGGEGKGEYDLESGYRFAEKKGEIYGPFTCSQSPTFQNLKK